jgi:hypothetical protein
MPLEVAKGRIGNGEVPNLIAALTRFGGTTGNEGAGRRKSKIQTVRDCAIFDILMFWLDETDSNERLFAKGTSSRAAHIKLIETSLSRNYFLCQSEVAMTPRVKRLRIIRAYLTVGMQLCKRYMIFGEYLCQARSVSIVGSSHLDSFEYNG